MYETEANRQTESSAQLPAEAIAQFAEARAMVSDRTVLPWSEHCTECVWPTCYSTCDLYSAREDGKCRRFVHGMVRVDCPEALNSYLLKITFKRWGKLWTPGNIHLRSVEKSLQIERRDYVISSALVQLPVPSGVKGFITGKRYSLKKRIAYSARPIEQKPSCFLLECYNPGTETVSLSLTMRSVNEKSKIPFQQLIELSAGFHRIRVPYAQIARMVDLESPFNVELIPNEDSREVTLYFGLIDFVREVQRPHDVADPKANDASKKVKCVVWDLDNTLWDGILVEEERSKLVLKDGVRETIEELDRRGILQSVASKNNHDEAMAALKHFQLDEFFLVPQISWLPKSDALQKIAQQLNIGLDSLLFVDDSEFERQQVSAALPDVRTFDASRSIEIAGLKECTVPVTAESRERRRMYRVEAERQDLAAGFADDYMAFLKHCEIRLKIKPMSEENLERVHELTQRTNQMNFSGNRYDRTVLSSILSAAHLDTYVLEVEDRFGSYGVVGFCIVDSREPRMTDLMFSCRIQSKRIEHAFLKYLIAHYIAKTGKDFHADYRKTPRNAPSGKVFEDIGMRELENREGVSNLVFAREQSLDEEGLVRITVQEPCSVA